MPPAQPSTAFPELTQLAPEQILALAPAWGDPQLLLRAARKTGMLEVLIKRLVLLEEQARSGPLDQLVPADWREQRWGDQVEQAFIANRRRFERVSFWELQLADKGQAMELYYQLCNGEVGFAELVRQHKPETQAAGAAGHQDPAGLVRDQPLHHLPKPLAKALRGSQPGVAHTPVRLGESFRLLQLEGWQPPALDAEIRKLMLRELEAGWLERELRRRLDRIAQVAVP